MRTRAIASPLPQRMYERVAKRRRTWWVKTSTGTSHTLHWVAASATDDEVTTGRAVALDLYSVYKFTRPPAPEPVVVVKAAKPIVIPDWERQAQRNRAAGLQKRRDRIKAEEFKPGWYERAETARLDRLDQRRDLVRYHASKRLAGKLQRTVAWADLERIKEIYKAAARMTIETGIPHAVDHIVPLQGKLVCGLHVENNLQIITASANSKKHNHFDAEAHACIPMFPIHIPKSLSA